MNPLVLLLVVASASGGLTFWQQQSINRVLAATAGLSGRILQTRAELASEQASLASARARLKQIEADLRMAKEDRAALAATKGSPLPTPEQEGWWPEKRPYFYLAKTCLSKVRFEGRPVSVEPGPGDGLKSLTEPRDYGWRSYQPFSDGGLNPHMAILLGMSDDEVAAVNESYSTFLRSVRDIEAAHVQRVEPPERDSDDGRAVVARLPTLTSETQPLRERWEEGLDQSLGASRAEILREHAARYFDADLDQLGAEPREFLRNGSALWVRFTAQWGPHMGGTTFNLNWNNSTKGQDWEYGHLFGPGAPCELR